MMMRGSIGSGDNLENRVSVSSLFLTLTMIIALLLLGLLTALAPSIISIILPAADSTRVLARSFSGFIIAAMFMIICILLHQDELAVTAVIAIHLYVDWYLGLEIVSQVAALVLLLIFFLAQSPRYPWAEPRVLWLWILFLALAILPAIHGIFTPRDALYYYPNIILGALIMFWLGTVVARTIASVRRLFLLLAAFGALIAIHTVILAATGRFLLQSSRFDNFLADVLNFQLSTNVSVYRLGSFFVDPNWNGTFFAMMLFVPLGLFCESSRPLGKMFYLAETFLMLLAMLFTYSTGAWVGTIVGVIAFIAFVGRTRYRVQLPLIIVIAVALITAWFPAQVNLLFQHTLGPSELSLRVAAWQTALRVIQAFPLTGVGLGLTAYLVRADPFRVLAQYKPLDHPHNSYLELGAMGGLPLLIVFVALLSLALWWAWCNWRLADVGSRSLLGAGVAAIVAFSITSFSINGWTLPPLAAVGWLILGVISSPLLAKSQIRGMMQGNSSAMAENT